MSKHIWLNYFCTSNSGQWMLRKTVQEEKRMVSPLFLKAFTFYLGISRCRLKLYQCCNVVSVLISTLFTWNHNLFYKSHVANNRQRFSLDQMAAIQGVSVERSDPVFVNINQQQSSNVTQKDVFHKSRAKCPHFLLHVKLLVPEHKVKS